MADQTGINLDGMMRSMEERGDEVTVSLLIYGHSGAGKTALGCSVGMTDGKPDEDVLVVLMEANGRATIRAINPKARIIDVCEVSEKTKVSPLNVFRDVLRQAKAGAFKAMGIRRITFDSLQEAQRLLKDEITVALEQAAMAKGIQVGTKDWIKATSMDWQRLKEQTRRMCRTIRDLPHDTVCIALAKVDEERNENGDVVSTYLRPALEGQVHNETAGYFTAVGYAYKVITGQDERGQPMMSHRVLFEADTTKILVKGAPGLPGIAYADGSALLGRLRNPVVPESDPLAVVSVKPQAGQGSQNPTTQAIPGTTTEEKPATNQPAVGWAKSSF